MRTKRRNRPKGPLFRKEKDGTFSIGKYRGVPDIRGEVIEDFTPEALFMGPNAENEDIFSGMVEKAIRHLWAYRVNYLPGDPSLITGAVKESSSFKKTVDDMKDFYDRFMGFLGQYSTPFFSPRYQAHMLGDNPMAAMAGYFSAMLHNPNNVTIEAATSTVPLEMLVGKDLCHMVGFIEDEFNEPFCHLNSGGSLCVIEALWSSREVRFFPFAVKQALEKAQAGEHDYEVLKPALDVEVTLSNGNTKPVMDATNWELFNIPADNALLLPEDMYEECKDGELKVNDVWDLVNRLGMNEQGWNHMWPACSDGVGGLPVYCVPSTKHYSWPKGGAMLGNGKDQLKNIWVDEDARMNIDELKDTLNHCMSEKIPVTSVTCVFGSTEESSVDDLEEVIKIRDDMRQDGLDFQVFVDAAWGGYITSMVRKEYSLDPMPAPALKATGDIFLDDTSNVPLNERTITQIKNIRHSDAVIIDPHKCGYIQYPAGAILYRNGDLKNLTLASASYIGGDIPPIGICGIEGSRPGAAAASVFTAHRCINPSVAGYGKILSNSLFNTKKFYVHMLLMESDLFVTTPLNRLPSEITDPSDGDRVYDEIDFIKQHIWKKTNVEIMENREAMMLFKQLGPDQNIVDYGFNFYNPDGNLNTDVYAFNKFNEAIYKEFSVEYDNGPEPVQKYPFIVSRTMFKTEEYGHDFVSQFARRNGLDPSTVPEEGIFCFRSTVMDPLDSDRTDKEYYWMLMPIIKSKIEEIANDFPENLRRLEQ